MDIKIWYNFVIYKYDLDIDVFFLLGLCEFSNKLICKEVIVVVDEKDRYVGLIIFLNLKV